MRGHTIRDDRGQAMVEFALIAPLLFLLVFGALEFGRAFNYWNDETHLSSVGARVAAASGSNTAPTGARCLDGTTPATLVDYIRCTADTKELRENAVISICPIGGSAPGTPIRVKVSLPFTFFQRIDTFFGASFFGPMTLTGSSEMRLERTWTGGSIGSCP